MKKLNPDQQRASMVRHTIESCPSVRQFSEGRLAGIWNNALRKLRPVLQVRRMLEMKPLAGKTKIYDLPVLSIARNEQAALFDRPDIGASSCWTRPAALICRGRKRIVPRI